MKDIGKQSRSISPIFRRYWWVFAVIVGLIVLALFRVATVHQEGESKLPAPTLAPLADVPESQAKLEVNAPARTRIDIATDHLELPYPQDVEALARYHGTKGRKNIRDAQAFWQKGADNYIDFLRDETFEQSSYHTHIPSEFWWVATGSNSPRAPHPDVIRSLVRTRRFSKVIAQVIEARQQGNVVDLVETISRNVSRLIQERRAVEQTLMRMMESEPEVFSKRRTRQDETRIATLTSGEGSTGFEDVDIPMSLHGAQLGIAANTFLLGLTGLPDAVRPIMDILAYQDRPMIDALCACECFTDQPNEKEAMAAAHVFANRAVVADALDRILVACADNQALNEDALSVARQYKTWRDSQDLPDREVIQAFTFDSPTTPYHLPGMISGGKEDAQAYELELPLPLWQEYLNEAPNYRLNEETIGTIIEWGERFNATLKGQ
ncbi:MAG TPA: hypothetical protein VMX13_01900 [Sedimentisphaerales bacterium]|nr:hypothetical protein [Sedimentisphaerales bacterium]